MKKLQRIKKEQKIAGVCNGLGDYFDVDPVFFRIIFLILMFGFGIGFLAYLIMWIIVPLKKRGGVSPQIQRIYRVEKNKKVAGICTGLGQYFKIDPVIFRVIFLVAVLAGGCGVIAYIFLYFVLPESKTGKS